MIMECVNNMQDSESEAESSESEPAPVKAKKRKAESSEESDYKPAKATGRKKKGGSSDGSDEDWSKSKSKPAGKKTGKFTGFTRPYKLSPELSSLLGAKELPRHEVVKKVWAIIKEKNLYDPKNKQYAICDKELEKVIGVKR